MARRLLVPTLRTGPNALPPDQAHHARDVLRLRPGDAVELFTPAGQTAAATLATVSPDAVIADVTEVLDRPATFVTLTVAAAVPKAARADWMIEKLSELGVARFVPLQTARSVVHPDGRNKLERWERLAAESAKQCRRPGVMAIDDLAKLTALIDRTPTSNPVAGAVAFLSTTRGARPLPTLLTPPPAALTLLVGPEGGWTPDEERLMADRGLTPVTLGATILRVETAAIAAAAVVAAICAPPSPNDPNYSESTP